ncbi:hypothetical protein WJX74_003577 [Apatococcus lobatus]|uniref:Uncharacterized protein n=1 Tax=Apatococcus lobatus TaxID=904363 RepID=A0AAW1QU42_9CHLO
MWWSPSTDQLAVHTHREFWERPAADAEHAGQPPVTTSNPGTSIADLPSEGAAKSASPHEGLPAREEGNPSDTLGSPSETGPASEQGLASEADVDDSMASVDDGLSDSYSDAGHGFQGQLWLLSPTSQKVDEVPCTPPGIPEAQWLGRCDWSPQGYLLLVRYGMSSAFLEGEGFSVLNPTTLEQVYSCRGPAEFVSWATNPPSRLVKPALSASITGTPALLDLSQREHGEWHVMKFDQSKLSHHLHLCISSDGSMLVGARRQGAGRNHAFHLPLADGAGGYVLPKLPIRSMHGAWMQWAPLPAAWPQIYAFVHWAEAGKRGKGKIFKPSNAAVSLVDSRKLSVLGSWTAKELSSLVKGRKLRGDETGEPQCVKWAPNGKHLAVLCTKCTLVMTFGKSS